MALFTEPIAGKLEGAAQQLASAAVRDIRPRTQPSHTGKPVLGRAETSVTVLNGNGRPGAAVAAAAVVHAQGYRVRVVGTAPRANYPRSIVRYRHGYEAEARRLARDVGVGAVGPLERKQARELVGAHVALIIGNDPGVQ